MNILRYEFLNSTQGSFNYMLGDIVRQIRYGYSNLQIEEFKVMITDLRRVEKKLQELDSDIRKPIRNYIQEILDELGKLNEIESQLIEELEWSFRTIIMERFNFNCNLDDFLFSYRNERAVLWLEFYGYQEEQDADLELMIVKNIFKSVCTKFNVTFIDLC